MNSSHYSTASRKSVCLALALLAFTSSASARDYQESCSTSSSGGDRNGNGALLNYDDVGSSSSPFESATIIHRLPIHLQPLPSSSSTGDDVIAQRNASVSESEFELPAELAAMIEEAKNRHHSTTTEEGDNTTIFYYPSYADDELCSSKSSSKFESWEESYSSLDECCESAFNWEYDACMGSLVR